jgi:hypothetical protein
MADKPSTPPKLPPSRDTAPYKFNDGRQDHQQAANNGSGGNGRPVLPPAQDTKPYKNGVQ